MNTPVQTSIVFLRLVATAAALLLLCSSPAAQAARPLFGVGLMDSVTVTKVVPGSLAAKAGLKVGDRIVIFDGKQVSRAADLVKLIQNPGAEYVPMVIQRGGVSRSMMVQMPKGQTVTAEAFFTRRVGLRPARTHA